LTPEEFAEALRMILDEGVTFTVIGGSIVEIKLGSRDLGDDIDLIAEDPDVMISEDFYFQMANRRGWVIGQTWLGTPRVLVRIGDKEVPIEFYDNLLDFYVPPSMLERAERVRVGGIRVKTIRLEDHIVLKANAGREKDIRRLKIISKHVKKGKLVLDTALLREAVSEFEESNVIIRRLKDAGIPF